MPVHPFPKTASNQVLSEASRDQPLSALPHLLESAAIIRAGVGRLLHANPGPSATKQPAAALSFGGHSPSFASIAFDGPAIQPIATIDLELQ